MDVGDIQAKMAREVSDGTIGAEMEVRHPALNSLKTAANGPPGPPAPQSDGLTWDGIPIGGFIVTSAHRRFYFQHPEQYTFTLEDIGHALSNLCRYAGHGPFYSVAQHSLFVAALLHSDDMLRGLLHDASEAYLVDVPGPLKALPELSGYRTVEARTMSEIHRQFGLVDDAASEIRVKWADRFALKAEALVMNIFTEEDEPYVRGIDLSDVDGWEAWFDLIRALTPEEACEAFVVSGQRLLEGNP